MFGKATRGYRRTKRPVLRGGPYGGQGFQLLDHGNYREAYGMLASTASCSTTSRPRRGRHRDPKDPRAWSDHAWRAETQRGSAYLSESADWGVRQRVHGRGWKMLQVDEPDDSCSRPARPNYGCESSSPRVRPRDLELARLREIDERYYGRSRSTYSSAIPKGRRKLAGSRTPASRALCR